jgi:leukotriene-A4 hydrolase
MALLDPHSYADADQPSTLRYTLELAIDFIAKTFSGTTTLELDRPASGVLDLDTRGLTIEAVTGPEGAALPFTLGEVDPIRGQRLRVETTADRVTIAYRTGAGATALQWLEAEQTAGKKAPFVYTQCQAIHARSVMPCQDTPRVRATYLAKLDVPDGLVAVMAASSKGTHAGGPGRSLYEFEMPQPIPSYLFALAVGDLVKRDLGPRSAVWAEPPTLEAAAYEFGVVDQILTTAEGLFGPYPWERFDLLVMPPSFPYGGMENPRLTFLTPSLLAGDRSLVNVVGHELAHSWTGNLVTNASMNDFWLNEGFTVYAERRILRALEGEAAEALHASLGRSGLDRDLARLSSTDPKLTRLRNRLEGVDPDDVYSLVPYEKGCLFLIALDRAVGRERFDRFLAEYIQRFRFQSITTETFLTFLDESLPEHKGKVDVAEWIDGVGLPKDAPAQPSARLERLQALAKDLREGRRPEETELAALNATEWQVFLSLIGKRLDAKDCAWLDKRFALSTKQNLEIRVGFLAIAAASGHEPSFPAIRTTLLATGRGKYLRPLYTGLLEGGAAGKKAAQSIATEALPGYHPVAQGMVESLLRSAT